MGLSSNSVIHFTKKLSALKGILTNGFDIRYCRETIFTSAKTFDLLVPIVSFCDIPFSQVHSHIDNYGCYGIGLRKKWAEEKGLNPVFYIEKNSIISRNIFHSLILNLKGDAKNISQFTEETRSAFDYLRYLKNYQGDLVRANNSETKNYRFSDEREWRYALNPKIEHDIYLNLIGMPQNEIAPLKRKMNDSISIHKLDFTPNDISYIITKKEKERDDLIHTLEKIKGNYSHQDVKRLTSRIITTEQLRTDF